MDNGVLVVTLHLFDVIQDIKLYKNGECIDEAHTSLDHISETICDFIKQYKIDKIEMCGNPSFVNKYVKELKTYNFTKIPTIEII